MTDSLPIRVLLIEDDPTDAVLIERELRVFGLDFHLERIDRDEELAAALHRRWDVILSDFNLPGWDGFAALRRVRRTVDDVPFIFISGSIGEDVAVSAMRAGADDYLLKDRLRRLGPALTRELQASRDRQQAREGEQARRLTELRYGQVLETAADAIISMDTRQRIQTFNRGAERTFGYSADEVVGRELEFLLPPRLRAQHRQVVADFLASAQGDSGRPGHTEMIGLRRDGSEFPAQTSLSKSGEGAGLVATAILRDITSIKQSEDRIRFLAHFDPLTHLPNRILFRERLEMACREASRRGRRVGVAILDLDRFKSVNDTRGHLVGDDLLAAVAARLIGTVREGDSVARLGGDEFGIILADLAHDEDAGPIAETVIRSLRYPLTTESDSFYSTGSAGLTIFPVDGRDPETLMANADLAMYRAKGGGGDRFEFYRPEMTAREQDRAAIQSDLAQSLREGALRLQFQPQISPVDGRVVGCEALARWVHPTRGSVPPTRFIQTAEESGLIVPLGREVLRQAFEAAAVWQGQLTNGVVMSVNASGTELASAGYPERLLTAIEMAGIDPSLVQLEVTEGAIAEDQRQSVQALLTLHDHGITCAIDDFGTGYSNLSRLKQMPISVLKIDQSLIRDLTSDAEDLAIVSAVITMAHQLGISTVAEGAESPDQIRVLTDLGCDVIQGFAFARPMWADDCLVYLKGREAQRTLPDVAPESAPAGHGG